MNEDLFSIGYYLTQLAASAPLLGTTIVGMVICYGQRRRRPRVSKLIGWALFAEFIWLTLGTAVITVLLAWVATDSAGRANETDQRALVLQIILWSLPGSIVLAIIWGTVLWAVLSVDDWHGETTHL